MWQFGKLVNKNRRTFILMVLGWMTIFLYEGVRQAIHMSDIGELDPDVMDGPMMNVHLEEPGLKNSNVEIVARGHAINDAAQQDKVIPLRHLEAEVPQVEGEFEEARNIVEESTHKCENVLRPSSVPPLLYDKWHVFTSPNHHIFVYSAFYDERIDNGFLPSIRILAVGKKFSNNTFCQIWYPDVTHPVVKNLIVRKSGSGHKLNKTHYDQYYFTCGLDTSYPIPDHVSIVWQPCDQANNYIPLYVPIRKPFKHEFAICVPVSFNYIDPLRLSEWVEAQKILGVTEINVYYPVLAAETMRVLEYYQKKGIVKLHHLPSVPFYENSRDGNKIGSPISLNDCMYRNMYQYKWIIVIDFDEIIVPRKHKNYQSMISSIDQVEKLPHPPPSYTFRNMYFWIGCGSKPKDSEKSIMLTHLEREKPSGFLYASKSIVNPRRCISVFNHYCYIRFPLRDKKERWTIDVKPDIATSHHYRENYSGKKGKEKCDSLNANGTADNAILKWKRDISRNTQKSWKELDLL